MINRELLLASLEVAVPLCTADLSRLPLRELLAEVRRWRGPVARPVPAETLPPRLFNGPARAVAILSFLVSGLRFGGVGFGICMLTRRSAISALRREPIDKVYGGCKRGDGARLGWRAALFG